MTYQDKSILLFAICKVRYAKCDMEAYQQITSVLHKISEFCAVQLIICIFNYDLEENIDSGFRSTLGLKYLSIDSPKGEYSGCVTQQV